MRPVKRRHDAIHLEPDPRTGSFDDCRVKRPEKCLDSAPLDRAKRSFAQDCKCFPMRGIHKFKISHFGIVSAQICALWKTGALNLPTLKIWMRWSRPTNKTPSASRRCTKPTLSTTLPTAEPPGPASKAFRSVSHPQRTGEYASGALGRETPRPRDLSAPRDGTAVNKVGEELRGQLRYLAGEAACASFVPAGSAA